MYRGNVGHGVTFRGHAVTVPLARRVCRLATVEHFTQMQDLRLEQHGLRPGHDLMAELVHEADRRRRDEAETFERTAVASPYHCGPRLGCATTPSEPSRLVGRFREATPIDEPHVDELRRATAVAVNGKHVVPLDEGYGGVLAYGEQFMSRVPATSS